MQDELGYAASARFSELGKPNTPEAVSKLQKLVIDLLESRGVAEPGHWTKETARTPCTP